MLDYGELIIRYKAGEETIYIKNENDNIIEFKSKDFCEDRAIYPLRAYLFDSGGVYTKDQFEDLLSTPLETLASKIKSGSPLSIYSTDSSSANVSLVIESNCELNENNELKSLTLFWHQYQMWCYLYATLNDDDTYTITLTKT